MSGGGLHDHLAGGACGACGYSTLGLTSLVCPECGADFRTAGIRTPHTPSPGRRQLIVHVVLFTGLYALAAMITVALLEQVVPKPRLFTYDLQLISPLSGKYQSVSMSTRARGLSEADPGLLPVTAELTPMPTAATTTAPATSQPPPLTLPPAAPGKPAATTAGVLAWFRTCGVDVSDPRVVAEARWIAADSRAMSRARPGTSWGNYASSTTGSAPAVSGFNAMSRQERGDTVFPSAVYAAVGALLLGLWIAGLQLLRVRVRNPSSPAASTRRAAR
jgi:hypothetical protein